MPHLRYRFLTPLMKKSLKFWPVICLVGPRQVGKSTLLKQMTEFAYLTFDDPGISGLAAENPKLILNPPCSIDEAQKVPGIFDAVKLSYFRPILTI